MTYIRQAKGIAAELPVGLELQRFIIGKRGWIECWVPLWSQQGSISLLERNQFRSKEW